MTETSSLSVTYSIPNSYAVTALPTSVSPIPNGKFSPPIVADEEEYTIKCICGYNDDDGNTVFCEKCDTWQHIECYYHGKKVPDIHFCTDCAPKDTFADINADKARERQRRARELLDGGGDRRVKRPAQKTQSKKKHRDTITTHPDQPNGWPLHERHESLTNGNSKDQPPPAKKPKTAHRPSGSIASLNGESRKRAHSTLQSYPSPSKSPQELYRTPSIPQYTTDFLELYNRDDGNMFAKDNEHTIQGSLQLSKWKNDPLLVASQPENAQNDKTPFVRTDSDWTDRNFPTVTVETMQNRTVDREAPSPTWKLVRLQSDVRKSTIVGEVHGQVGTLDEYCQQLTGPNRWKDLSHPDPFVFFHPHINVYIDSRRSGTQFRYIRRSCDPNVTMRSYITADDEVHHCFVANQDIQAGTELTASWYLSPQFLDKEQQFQERCDYISRVLANFGDCACGLPKCRLDAFDRRIHNLPDLPKPSAGRKKKVKTKHAISPQSNGQPTTSRAGSETVKAQDEDDDNRSSSSSSGNGIRSRDLTPQGGALLDEPPMLGAGLTQREIRKIQALEKAAQDKNHKTEKKQKKRPSGTPNLNTPNTGSRSDAKRYSGSPPPLRALQDASNRSTPSKQMPKLVRPVYVSAAVQTDPEPCEQELPLLKRRKFCTPTQRLLKKLLHHRTQSQATSVPTSPELTENDQQPVDAEMKDATTSVSTSPSTMKSAGTSPIVESPVSPTGPLPSQAAHTQQVHGLFKQPAPRLSLSSLPPVPTFSSTASSTTPSVTTPGAIAQSPGLIPPSTSGLTIPSAAAVTPSPAKKKLSLGDYMSRRKESSTPATEKPSLLSGSSDLERRGSEAKSDTDPKEKLDEAEASTTQAAGADVPENEEAVEDTPMADASEVKIEPAIMRQESSAVQNILSSLHEMQKKQNP